MITISDLNVSREACLTELKDSEMMGHIIGGSFKIGGKIKFGIPFTFGNPLLFDQDGDGTIEVNEFYTPFGGTFDIEFSFG
ncbi:hypothetical protein [Moorena sp. SIO4A5]|uniref:hypothetical protein n=1 Tax=Moorena sp. SIO4A5 TaxID=2607838 RepID=UPI0013CAEBD8|nr:hypothetical protein [Moorena sp. SIO4A5]NEO24142.1 hypothetical protein [Moorena sp. SIO4A5]